MATALVLSLLLAGCAAPDAQVPPSDTSSRPDPTAGSGPEPTAEPSEGPEPSGAPPPEPQPAPEPEQRTWADPATATIRPGVQTFTDGGQCTADFVFTDRTDDSVYLGQAAHCASTGGPTETNGCETGSKPLGTRVGIEGASVDGTLAYSSWISMQARGEANADACQYNDFALVRIDPADVGKVSPAMRVYGGPTSMARPGDWGVGDKVLTYGNSDLRFGVEPIRPREGYVLSASDWTTSIYTAGPGVPGDSGSAVLTGDGQALGVLVTLQSVPPAGNGVTSLAKALEYAASAGSDVELATWDLIDGGVLP